MSAFSCKLSADALITSYRSMWMGGWTSFFTDNMVVTINVKHFLTSNPWPYMIRVQPRARLAMHSPALPGST
jgi:hypothetical protein